ncbi:MAG: SAM-dependent methyltransferase [Chloroflexota bacterium]|nr:SAM-dependent methyltransferase [Chloroflexota bacterium]
MALDLDPGLGAAGNPALVKAIIEEMDGGAIPFERFMELALYHPEHGYYRKPGRIGTAGDFLTSPVIHPMFGWAAGAWCEWVWEGLGRPSPFTIIEPGAGEGTLATSLLDWAEGRGGEFAEALRYVAIEPNARGSDTRIDWRDEAPPVAEAGVVLSNELFDALPVRLFEVEGRGPVEVWVRWDGEAFVEARGGVATIDGAPSAGRFEVSGRAHATMLAMCDLIERGAVLTFDYGYPEEELWADWRTQGTLLCFYRHTAHEDPYRHVGEQDLTAHVNLSELELAMELAGFTAFAPVTQAAFLTEAGLGGLVESVRDDLPEYFARRRAFQQLTDAAGLGRIRVLAGIRGVEGVPPGFGDTE